MHELSVAKAVVDTATRALAAAGAMPAGAGPPGAPPVVREVHVRVGVMSGVVADALLFCFDVVAAGTPLAGARLVVEAVPVLARCDGCGIDTGVDQPPIMVCPACGSPLGALLAGRELEISHLVVDDDAADLVAAGEHPR